jgi:hypothetical protein
MSLFSAKQVSKKKATIDGRQARVDAQMACPVLSQKADWMRAFFRRRATPCQVAE